MSVWGSFKSCCLGSHLQDVGKDEGSPSPSRGDSLDLLDTILGLLLLALDIVVSADLRRRLAWCLFVEALSLALGCGLLDERGAHDGQLLSRDA